LETRESDPVGAQGTFKPLYVPVHLTGAQAAPRSDEPRVKPVPLGLRVKLPAGFPGPVVVGEAVPAAECRWGLYPRCSGVETAG